MAFRRCDVTRLGSIDVDGLLRSYTRADGDVKTLASGVQAAGAIAWGERGIVFARDRALWILRADGGQPRQITSLDTSRREVAHNGPMFLPDGQTVLSGRVRQRLAPSASRP